MKTTMQRELCEQIRTELKQFSKSLLCRYEGARLFLDILIDRLSDEQLLEADGGLRELYGMLRKRYG